LDFRIAARAAGRQDDRHFARSAASALLIAGSTLGGQITPPP
jgi:hypothetical protein